MAGFQPHQNGNCCLEHDPQAAAERLDELKSLVGETITEVRRFTRALRPIYLEDLGLLPALEMLVRDVRSEAGDVPERPESLARAGHFGLLGM